MNVDGFSLAATTADLSEEPAAREHADCVEFRMDLAAEPLDALAAYDGELPLLVTNRPDWEGGDAQRSGRLDALTAAIRYDAVEAVDIELASLRGRPTGRNDATPAALFEGARERGVTVVASVHDVEGTPAPGALDALLSAAAAAGDVGKLATTAAGRGDALALLAATHRATARGERVATMAMGEAGRHTRAVAPIYGSQIGYAPVRPEAATEAGQFDLATLRELVDRLS